MLATNHAATPSPQSLGARLRRDGRPSRVIYSTRRGHAEQVQRPRDGPLRRHAQREPERLERSRLGADDRAVAVERGERLRELERVRRRSGAARGARPPRPTSVGKASSFLISSRSAGCSCGAVAGLGASGPRLARLAQDRGDPRVRVLHVVDRVLGRLLAREVEVEVDRRVVRALQHEEARRVDADLVDQLVERDELAAALGHRRALAALDEVDELQHRDLERVGIGAERRHRRLHARDVAVMVGAERR